MEITAYLSHSETKELLGRMMFTAVKSAVNLLDTTLNGPVRAYVPDSKVKVAHRIDQFSEWAEGGLGGLHSYDLTYRLFGKEWNIGSLFAASRMTWREFEVAFMEEARKAHNLYWENADEYI